MMFQKISSKSLASNWQLNPMLGPPKCVRSAQIDRRGTTVVVFSGALLGGSDIFFR